MPLPEEDQAYRTKKYMEEYIVVCLGGRVAEKLTMEDISTGAYGDIKQATQMARAMVTSYGMSDKIGRSTTVLRAARSSSAATSPQARATLRSRRRRSTMRSTASSRPLTISARSC